MKHLPRKLLSPVWRSAFIITMLLLEITRVSAQNMTITGKVTDASSGEALIGATIQVKGTASGSITDVDGSYTLENVMQGATLIASYVGYDSQEALITGIVIDFILQPETRIIDEVVITALGIEKDKARIGYSIQQVKGSELTKAREPNALNSLTGKVAGLFVGSSPELLGGPSLTLRGKTPVIIVDGVPIQSDSWNINPDDIENFTVLKGTQASALYGSRGIDGAIMITTKRGKKDEQLSVEFNSSNMIDGGFIAIPEVQSDYGPGDHGKYWFVDGKGGGLNDGDYDIWGPKFEGQLVSQYDSPVDEEGNRIPTPWTSRGKDNLERFLEKQFITSNNLSISAAGDKYDIRFSATYTFQNGMVPNTELNTTNLNLTAGYNLSDKLRWDASVNFNRQATENYPDIAYGPNSIIYNIITWGGADWDIDDMRDYWQPGKEGIQSVYAEYQRYHNPYFMSYEWLRGHYKTDLYGYASLSYHVLNNLQIKGRTQLSTWNVLRTEKLPFSAHPYGREAGLGDYREDRRTLYDSNTDILVDYNEYLLPELSIHAAVGGNVRIFGYNSGFQSSDYLNVPGWYNLNNSLNPKKAYNYNSDMQVYSAYGFLDMNLTEAFTLSLTGRFDKHSTLPEANNTYFYPSVALSGVLSELFTIPAVSYLKVRGSYAVVGKGFTDQDGAIPAAYIVMGDDFIGYGGDYYTPYDGPAYTNSAVYDITFPYNNQAAASYNNTQSNPDLEPYKSRGFETGLDVKFVKNRIGIEFTYFNMLDGPQIFQLPVSQATGYDYQLVNGLEIERSGYEVSLNIRPIQKNQGLNWDIVLNYATLKRMLKEVYEGVDTYNSYIKTGERYDQIYGSKFFKTGEGELINDESGRPVKNPISQFLGYADPDFTWGFISNMSYQNLSFMFQFDGAVGGKIVDHIQRQTFRGGRHIETVQGAMGESRYQDYLGNKSWVGEGVVISNGGSINYDNEGNITNLDALTFEENTVPTYLQDWISRYYNSDEGNLMSKTYAKLREVRITYRLPQKFLPLKSLNSLELSLVGRNLLYFAENSDVDVEPFIYGYSTSIFQTPSIRTYGFNLNVKF